MLCKSIATKTRKEYYEIFTDKDGRISATYKTPFLHKGTLEGGEYLEPCWVMVKIIEKPKHITYR